MNRKGGKKGKKIKKKSPPIPSVGPGQEREDPAKHLQKAYMKKTKTVTETRKKGRLKKKTKPLSEEGKPEQGPIGPLSTEVEKKEGKQERCSLSVEKNWKSCLEVTGRGCLSEISLLDCLDDRINGTIWQKNEGTGQQPEGNQLGGRTRECE